MSKLDDEQDVAPTGEEAEAQREATVMPWVWGVIGLIAVAAFAVWAIFVHPLAPPAPAPQHGVAEGPAHS